MLCTSHCMHNPLLEYHLCMWLDLCRSPLAGLKAILPASRKHACQRIALAFPAPKRSAACRREDPASIASITRPRRSTDSSFQVLDRTGIIHGPALQIIEASAVRRGPMAPCTLADNSARRSPESPPQPSPTADCSRTAADPGPSRREQAIDARCDSRPARWRESVADLPWLCSTRCAWPVRETGSSSPTVAQAVMSITYSRRCCPPWIAAGVAPRRMAG